jgi:hypothetical protein
MQTSNERNERIWFLPNPVETIWFFCRKQIGRVTDFIDPEDTRVQIAMWTIFIVGVMIAFLAAMYFFNSTSVGTGRNYYNDWDSLSTFEKIRATKWGFIW